MEKWNFNKFTPGLVGGHCIGVDPYYLTHKAQSVGYHPEMILAGRRLNDGMGQYVVSQLVKRMVKKRIHVEGARVLVMGLTFKENCADIRNSGVKSVFEELKKYNCELDLYDPWANNEDIKNTYGILPNLKLNQNTYDGIIIAVGHDKFKDMGIKTISDLCKKDNVIYDLKYLFPSDKVDLRL